MPCRIWPHVRPCGATPQDDVCACGCGADDSACGTYSSHHPNDEGIPEGVTLGDSNS